MPERVLRQRGEGRLAGAHSPHRKHSAAPRPPTCRAPVGDPGGSGRKPRAGLTLGGHSEKRGGFCDWRGVAVAASKKSIRDRYVPGETTPSQGEERRGSTPDVLCRENRSTMAVLGTLYPQFVPRLRAAQRVPTRPAPRRGWQLKVASDGKCRLRKAFLTGECHVPDAYTGGFRAV
jgi:hypothetical protein